MSKTLSKYRTFLLLLADGICILVGYLLALFIRFDLNVARMMESGHVETVIRLLPIVLVLNVIFLLLFKSNRTLWRYFSIDEVMRVSVAVCLANFIWFVVIFSGYVTNYPRSIPVIATLLIVLEMLAVRCFYRLYRRRVHSMRKSSRAIIIGAGDAGSILAREITYSERYNSKIVGFVDESDAKQNKIILGYPVLGKDMDLPEIAKKHNVNLAYVAIPTASQEKVKKILDMCQEANLHTKIMVYGEKNDKVSVRDVSIEDLLGRGEIHLDSTQIGGYLTGKVVFVSGAGGSIGSELCRQILKFKPSQLVMLDIYENNLYALQQEINIKKRSLEIDESIEEIYLIGSVRDKVRLDKIMEEYHPSVVFHAAAHKHVPLMEDSPKEAIKNNVFGTYKLVKSSIEHKVDRFILISTDKAVNPTNVMGATKRMCELIIQAMGKNGVTKISAVRFGNVLGSNGSVIPLFKQQIMSGGPLTVTHPDIKRYFMTIPEAAQLVLQAGSYAHCGEIFVLDMGKPVKILKLAENLITLSGLKPYEDIQIEFTGLRPGEKMFEELSLNEEDFGRTENKLIFVAKPTKIEVEELERKLSRLQDIIQSSDDIGMIKDVLLEEINTEGILA